MREYVFKKENTVFITVIILKTIHAILTFYFQVENEYGGLIADGSPIDTEYLLFLKDTYTKYGVVELMYTSDNPSVHAERGSIPGRKHNSQVVHLPTFKLVRVDLQQIKFLP